MEKVLGLRRSEYIPLLHCIYISCYAVVDDDIIIIKKYVGRAVKCYKEMVLTEIWD